MTFEMRVSLQDDCLCGRIVGDVPPDARFAFSIHKNEKKIHARDYSGDRAIRYPLGDKPGIYTVSGFVKYGVGESVAHQSKAVVHVGQPIPLERLSDRCRCDGPQLVRSDDFDYPCLFLPKVTRRLFVLLSAAIDRRIVRPPYFNRWSWAARFPGSVLCVSDPTLELKDDLSLGWYLGHAGQDATTGLASTVQFFAKAAGIDSKAIVAYGSSGGGFAALSLAARLPGSTAVTINPQTDIARYRHRAVNQMLETCFPGVKAEELAQTYRSRVSMTSAYRDARHSSRVIYVQNRKDVHHHREHFLPFADIVGLPVDGGCSADGRHYAFVYDHDNGHGPEPEELFPRIIRKIVEFTPCEQTAEG